MNLYTETGFNFEKWRQDRETWWNNLRVSIEGNLRAGDRVIEFWGHPISWAVTGTKHYREDEWQPEDCPFIDSAMTPEYLSDHLVNRAKGFGFYIGCQWPRESKTMRTLRILTIVHRKTHQEA